MSPRKKTSRQGALALLSVLLLASCKGESGAEDESAGPEPSAKPAPVQSTWATDPGKRLEAGDDIPDFSAVAHTGYRVERASLGDGPEVLYFCDAITESPCDKQTLAIRDRWLELVPEVSMVYGVSRQDNVAHRDFASEHDLPFLLLSDADGQVRKTFGVGRENASERVTFVLGGNGEIAHVFVDPDPERHPKEIVAALSE